MRRIAVVLSTVGFHWEEVYDAYEEFKDFDCKVAFYTVEGKPAKSDPLSVEERRLFSFFNVKKHDFISPETELGIELSFRIKNDVHPISEIDIDSFDAIYLSGGHGCLFDVNVNPILHAKLLEAYEKRKILAAVCHASSTLAFVKKNNKAIIFGKKTTGFPDFYDNVLLKTGSIYKEFLPLPFSNQQMMKNAGANNNILSILLGIFYPKYHIVDLPFITGVGPMAIKKVVKSMMENIKDKSSPIL